MSARDELSRLANGGLRNGVTTDDFLKCRLGNNSIGNYIADAILAAGYRKPRTISLWGASFVHNGAFYKEYSTKEGAQAFVDEMGEVGAHLVVVTREHTPAVYSEWVTA